MANYAIDKNPPDAVIHITTNGSNWLWALFAALVFTDLIVLAWHFTVPRGQRIFHQLAVIILTTASIAYFSMASNLGSTPVETEFAYLTYPAGTTRQIWYVRYIDWIITTPALLLELVLASGLPLSDIVTLIFFDIVMIVTGLVGSLVVSSYKWGYWCFGTVALFYIYYALFGPARTTAGVLGREYKKSFTISAGILSILWLLYPLAWGLADGSSYITPDSEMIFYGILDFFAKPVFCLVHLFLLSKLDLTALQLSSGKFSASAAGVNAYDREKNAHTVVENNHSTTAGPVGKKGMFSKKGKYDATAAPVAPVTNEPGYPRTSEATVAA